MFLKFYYPGRKLQATIITPIYNYVILNTYISVLLN